MWHAWREKLAPLGQEHLLAFVDRLDAPAAAKLRHQLEQIDWVEFARLRSDFSGNATGSPQASWQELARRAEPPRAIRLNQAAEKFTRDQAQDCGEQALRAGRIGMILVAGGLGTRLGFDQPKGLFPLGPVSHRTLFQILIDKLRAVARRYEVSIPLFIMTSPATHEATARYMDQEKRCGLPASELHLFQQGTMYAVDAQSFEILLASPGEIFTGPDGHGGMLTALDKSGCLQLARDRGIEHFFYGQIDNPLLTVCDPEFLGSHLLAGSELTTQAVAKIDPAERVGVLATIDGRTQIIEYVDLPQQQARERFADGTLKFWAGNTAVHVFARSFLERMLGQADALPFHTAKKKVPFIGPAGNLVEPQEPNAIRFERFIFDLLPQAQNPLVVEVSPAEAFAPVKNDNTASSDSPRTSQAALMAQARRQLAAAEVEVIGEVPVEINPLWALDADAIRARLPAGTKISEPTYFCDSPDATGEHPAK